MNVSRETSPDHSGGPGAEQPGDTLHEIKEGIRETWAVGLGLIPLGLAFGLLMTQTGFAWWWTPIFSIVIFAGSMEFLAISMVTSGVGPLSAAFTGFMVNFRHIFYGLTFPLHKVKSVPGKAYSAYALIDEAYAIVSVRDPRTPLTGTRILTIQILLHLLWLIPGIVGALVGEIIPPELQGMDFALTALFVVLGWEAFKNNRDYSLPVIAAVLAILVSLVAPGSIMMIALSAYFLILIARYISPRLDDVLTWRNPRSTTAGTPSDTTDPTTKEV